MNPHQFLDAIREYCKITGASVTSYGRTAKHNASLPGSVEHSPHLVWMGADVVYDGLQDSRDRLNWALRLGLKLVVEADHDHLQPLLWLPG